MVNILIGWLCLFAGAVSSVQAFQYTKRPPLRMHLVLGVFAVATGLLQLGWIT